MARMAGDNLNNYFSGAPQFGDVGAAANQIKSKERQMGFELGGQMIGSGLDTFGRTYGNKLISDAEGQLAQAQGNAAMMETAGGIAKSVLGGIASFSGGGGGFNPSTVNFSSPTFQSAQAGFNATYNAYK